MADLDHIEHRVAADRARLARSLDALTDTVQPQGLADQVSDVVASYGGTLGNQAWDAARTNPAAFALVGAGLSLLLTGPGKPPATQDTPVAVDPMTAMDGFDARVAQADHAIKKDMTGEADMDTEIERSTRMRQALDAGLDALPDAARARVRKARQAALDAQDKLTDHARQNSTRAQTLHQQQPLAVGAIALGMGALIGAMLPPSRKEDEWLGTQRDALLRKAQATLENEMRRANAKVSEKLDSNP
ncbi:hypothetical protein [Nereida sp. MMG025]|uniref:hypothetical protein n=1 Tax=Nereida sp. MMG025 TaxID=2909981 RepID=UPI001F364463|nr:hypothetical protein [Nereida sp. MMG025]MCF6445869.1 hypothetical protein [Nereida sp. MMG025]